MQISEIMHKGIISVNINDSIRHVAELMRNEDIGAVPVLDQNRPVGFVTDRDIVISCVAEGFSTDGPISNYMTKTIVSVTADQNIEEVNRLMQDNQVSRVLVVDKQQHPIGMISIKDLAKESEDLRAETVAKIKEHKEEMKTAEMKKKLLKSLWPKRLNMILIKTYLKCPQKVQFALARYGLKHLVNRKKSDQELMVKH